MDFLRRSFALALIVTLANAAKPVVVDDTAYLAYARQIAEHPLDPYGFTFHWYTFPESAMHILVPPVLPYWLGLGIRLFGEHIVLLKLWLFPFLWLFTYSLNSLLKRFARGTEWIALPLIVLSPAVLPTVNFMLDIPAAALGLAALAMFTSRAASWRRAVLAGLLAGLAMQTKYTGMLAPAAILWFGITHGRFRLAVLAGLVATAVFAGWEAWLYSRYGESHFLYHLADQRASTGNWLHEKSALIPGLVGHLGLLGFGIAMWVAGPLGVSNRVLAAAAIVWFLGVASIYGIPEESFRARNVWRPAGTGVMLVAAASAGILLLRRRQLRSSRDSWFVIGWVLLELAGYFLLTPFPAARRVIGLTIAIGVLAARVVRLIPARKPPTWILPFGFLLGASTAGLDAFDAFWEQLHAQSARVDSKRTWFAGHWGFQYYCEREGYTLIVPGESVLQRGDYLVLPIQPDDGRFHRPHIGLIPIQPPPECVELLTITEFPSGPLVPRTVPNFYGGSDPIEGWRGPKMSVGIYYVAKPWAVPGR